jgi:hypothetical protein
LAKPNPFACPRLENARNSRHHQTKTQMKKHLDPTINTLLSMTGLAVFGQLMDVKAMGICLAGLYRASAYSKQKIKSPLL